MALRPQRTHAPLDKGAIEIADEEAMNVPQPASDRHRQAAGPDYHGKRLPWSDIGPRHRHGHMKTSWDVPVIS